MKNLKSILLLFVFLLTLSCSQDNKSDNKITQGAFPSVFIIKDTDIAIKKTIVSAGTNLNLGVKVGIQAGDVASVDLVGFYTKGSTVTKGYFKKNITNFPFDYSFNQTDIFNTFSNIKLPADIIVGNSMIITAEITLKNGNIIKIYNDNGTDAFGSGVKAAYPNYSLKYVVIN